MGSFIIDTARIVAIWVVVLVAGMISVRTDSDPLSFVCALIACTAISFFLGRAEKRGRKEGYDAGWQRGYDAGVHRRRSVFEPDEHVIGYTTDHDEERE